MQRLKTMWDVVGGKKRRIIAGGSMRGFALTPLTISSITWHLVQATFNSLLPFLTPCLRARLCNFCSKKPEFGDRDTPSTPRTCYINNETTAETIILLSQATNLLVLQRAPRK
jgi:hypothetical protein